MATTWKAPTWRMPNEKNQSKFENYALTFDGNEYIDCGNDSSLNITSTITLSAWVKPTTAVTSQNYPMFVAKGLNCYMLFGNSATGGVRFRLSGSVLIDSDSTIPTNEWTHVVGTYDGSNLRIYLNGSLDKTVAHTGTIPVTTDNVQIGATNGGNKLTGNLSEVAIFDYALSSTQVSSLYNSGSPINPMTLKPAPVAYYPLGGNASTGGDATNTLSVPNVAVPDASVFDFPSLTSGDYIDTNYNLDGLTSFTVSAWFNADNTTANAVTIVSTRTGAISASKGFDIYIAANGLYWRVYNNGATQVLQTFTNTTDWQHVVLTYDGSVLRAYLNGSLVNSATGSYITSDANMLIGKWNNGANYFDGQISNVQVWGDELALSDIETLYNNGQPLLTGTQPQEANLKAWYKLNQSANWEADSSGNWQIPDAVSAYPQSFEFISSDTSQINLGDVTYLDGASELTLSAWVKPTAAGTAAADAIFGKDGPTRGFYLATYTGNKFRFFVSTTGSSNDSFNSNASYTIGEWIHLAATWDGSNMKIYINGSEDNSRTTTNATGTLQNNSNPFEIGNLGNYSGPLNAFLSNAQVWTTALPATGTDSIETLYNNGVPLTTAIASDNLKGWWKLDNNEIFDGANWSVENQKYPANYESAIEATELTGLELDSATPNLGTTQSFSWWVNYKKPSLGSYLWNKGSNGWRIYVYNNGTLLFRPTSSNTYMLNTGTGVIQAHQSIGNGKWYHYVLTRDGENVVIYQNSVSVYTGTIPGTDPAPATDDIDFIASEYGTLDVDTKFSNFCIFNNKLEQSDITSLYNNGTPLLNMDSFTSLQNWWKLNNLTTGLQASAGSINASVRSGTPGFNEVNTFVSTEAGTSSGMTEQNLVNNNVSALNGESSGMTSANLVTSTLTRQVPYNSYSMYFDGTGDELDFSSSTFGAGLSNFSVSAWAKFDGSSSYECISSVDGLGGRVWQLFQWSLNRGLAFQLFNNSGTGVVTPTNSFINASNTWYHVVGTYDGSNIKLYVNGNLEATAAQTGTVRVTTAENLKIGNNGYNEYLEGNINNVSLYDKALTSTEVLKLYNSGVPGNLYNFNPQPNHWWSLGSDSYFDGTNWVCPDLISTLNNTTSSGLSSSSLVGNAPNSSANGTSTNMTYDANLTGSAPNSSNNSFSVNMSYDDRVSGSGDVPG